MLQGTVFDYYVDEKQVAMAHWSQRVPQFTYSPENFSALFVPTVETTRLTYLLELLVPNKHHVMFVGNSGKCTWLPVGLLARGAAHQSLCVLHSKDMQLHPKQRVCMALDKI